MTSTSEKVPIERPRDETSHDVQCPHDSEKKKRIFIRSGRDSVSVPPLPCIPRGEALKIEPLGLGRSTVLEMLEKPREGNVGRLMSWMSENDQICLL